MKKMIKQIFPLIFLSTFFLSFSFGQQKNHLHRAISAMEIGLFDESLKQLNKALKTDPTNAQIYKLKALLYEALKDNENAIISWNKCIKYSKNKDMINEAKIHLDYLNEF
jgi:Tfp pilus assembly protein PilF|tara:strand:- start:217 stop:546 length:330 start_codon:yes stop_codon:yes gene_type:complete